MCRKLVGPMRALLHSALPFAIALLVAGCRANLGAPAVEACEPGEVLVIGCAEGCGIGACEGDPVLRICDGSLGVSACGRAEGGMDYVEVDDTDCGRLCPRIRVTCPVSGSVVVSHRGLGSRYVCDWEVEHRGVLPPGGRAPGLESCTPGTPVQVGCSLSCGLGECMNASLRTCDGASGVDACASGTADVIRENTGSSSSCDFRCPEYVVSCPASGSLAVVPRPTSSTADFVCEWVTRAAAHRPGATEICTPGTRVVVGCASGCGSGSCVGDGVLRVCDGNVTPEACLALTDTTMTLGQTTSSSCDSSCPQLQVVCPGSGAITVVSRSQYADEGFGCDWITRPAGLGE